MILFRYICREIYLCLLIITVILVSVLVINEFSHFLKGAAAGRYSIMNVLMLVMLQLPPMITYILPLGLFLGILVGIGRLYTDNEMTVMMACGMSLARQVVTVMSLAVGVALFAAWLSLWVNPRAVTMMTHLRLDALNNFRVGTLMPHRFEEFGDGRVVYVGDVSHAKNRVNDVFLAVADQKTLSSDHPKWDIIRADEADQTTRSDTPGKFVVLQNGSRYSGIAGQADVTRSNFKRYGINIVSQMLYGKHHTIRKMEHKEIIRAMPSMALFARTGHDRLADAEWQLRISVPISIIIASLIAVACSEVDPRRGRYFKVVPAILLYIVYACMVFLSQSWIKNGTLPGSIGMWWIHGTMCLVALVLFSWRMGWQRLRHMIGVM